MEYRELEKFNWAFEPDKVDDILERIFNLIGFPPFSAEQAKKIYDLGYSDACENSVAADEDFRDRWE